MRRIEAEREKTLARGHLFHQNVLSAHCEFHSMQLCMYLATTSFLLLLCLATVERQIKIPIPSIIYVVVGGLANLLITMIIFLSVQPMMVFSSSE